MSKTFFAVADDFASLPHVEDQGVDVAGSQSVERHHADVGLADVPGEQDLVGGTAS
jgi:hypothetical protein